MQAIILAAGMGTRIREHHVLPKGFIPLGGKPIIDHSISALKQVGINDILLVCGYGAAHYIKHFSEDDSVHCIENNQYASTSSLYSLFCARSKVNDDCLVLESDIYYDKKALTALLDDQHPTAILVSGETQSGDEVYVAATQTQLLSNMSKIAAHCTAPILGEFVGITKLAHQDFHALMILLDDDAEEALLMEGHYEEQGLVALANHHPVYCLKVDDLQWCEIDDVAQLSRARRIYDKLNAA